VVPVKPVLSAAFAALVLTSPLAGQQQAITAVTLADALRLSQRVAPSVVSASNGIRSAELNTRAAIWSFIPAVTLTPAMNLALSSGQSRLDPVTGEIISGNSHVPSYSWGLTASYTLFDGFARNYALKQSRAQQSVADAQLITSQFASDFNATTTFFSALAQKQLVAVAQSSLDGADGQLRLASAKLHAGTGQLSDSLTALGSYLQVRLNLLSAQNALVVNETNLGRLVGVPGRVAAIDDSAFYRVPPSLDTAAIRTEVMTTAPSIKSLEASLVASQQAYKVAKAAYFPTLTATAGQTWTGYWAGGTQPATPTPVTIRRTLNVGLSITPWTSFAREQRVENALLTVDNVEASLADQRNALAAQINQAYATLSTAQETINVSAAARDAGEENLRVVTERYRIGVATITDVLTAQTQAVSAAAAQVSARYNYLLAKAQIEQILGRRL
jgi:outer membrane protein TolC